MVATKLIIDTLDIVIVDSTVIISSAKNKPVIAIVDVVCKKFNFYFSNGRTISSKINIRNIKIASASIIMYC